MTHVLELKCRPTGGGSGLSFRGFVSEMTKTQLFENSAVRILSVSVNCCRTEMLTCTIFGRCIWERARESKRGY